MELLEHGERNKREYFITLHCSHGEVKVIFN